MRIIELIYITTTLISVLTALPQLKRLWTVKSSDEFSLSSWVAWLVAQITALVYALSIASVPYLIVNLLWITFYVLMIFLIIKYRDTSKKEAVYVPVEQTERDL
jgi:uncharacterized protein with PQ loop repeat